MAKARFLCLRYPYFLRSQTKSAASGFTLIEVMVALIIFALLSVTLLLRIGDNLRAQQHLESKNTAVLVAANTLAGLRIQKDWDNVRSKTETVTMAGQDWLVDATVTDTPNKNLRRVDVKVGLRERNSSKNLPIFTLTSFIGHY